MISIVGSVKYQTIKISHLTKQFTHTHTHTHTHTYVRTMIAVIDSGLSGGKVSAHKAEGRIVESESHSHSALIASLSFCACFADIHSEVRHALKVLGRYEHKQAHTDQLQTRDKL